jgi:hypothetical protein
MWARTCGCRPTPLTASGGANAVNSSSSAGVDKDCSDTGSPAVKKAKAVADKARAKTAAAKKRSLKRL